MGFLWLVACTTPAFVAWLNRGLEHQFPQRDVAMYPQADVIVVIGGDGFPGDESDWNNDQGDAAQTRVGFGYLLYKAGKAPVIVLSAGQGGALRMSAMLQQHGVPSSAIRIESRSNNTYENAIFSSHILDQEGLRRILLVTSAAHMPRAAAAFSKQGLEVIPAPARNGLPLDILAADAAWRPQRLMLWRSHQAFHEYIGFWVYKLCGRA
ncbi:YdcF family protein [Dyella silvatica]|uniref:YdcF family protein n=1 Tax=Dyella silvatica TaxID=2992128 RepID=UPI00224E1DC7|nr:YdcF family protein [Dyella silvatica]